MNGNNESKNGENAKEAQKQDDSNPQINKDTQINQNIQYNGEITKMIQLPSIDATLGRIEGILGKRLKSDIKMSEAEDIAHKKISLNNEP